MNSTMKKSVSLYSFLLYCVIALAVVLAVVYFVAEQNVFGALVLIAAIFLAVVTLIGILAFRRSLSDQIVSDSVEIANREMHYLQNWDFPYALFREDGTIVWHNESFAAFFWDNLNGNDEPRLTELMEQVVYPEDRQKKETQQQLNGSTCRLEWVRCEIMNGETNELSEILYSVTIMDITREITLETENNNIRPIVALIYIDNYDQTMSSVEETTRPILEAMVYKRLNDLTASVCGVMTRMEKDRLFLIFPHEYLSQLKETRFDVLEDVRKINMGNRLPVTLSIGVGVADRLEEAHTKALAAVDLALGRGGDQAVLRDHDDTLFYGGKSGGIDKSNRVRARLIAHAVREIITDADQVLIMGHTKPDMDCFGASVGLASAIHTIGRKASIVITSDRSAIEGLLRRVHEADPPYKIIGAREAMEACGPRTLVIVVDVNRPAMVDLPELLDKSRSVVVVDHHRTSVDNIANTVVSYVEPGSSSASEMVTELIQYMSERVDLKPYEADSLMAGISLDTKNFVSQTKIRTFEAAAFLRRYGADTQRVRNLFKNELDEYRWKTKIVSGASIEYEKMAISGWDGRMVSNAQILAAAASDELMGIKGVEASFVATQLENCIAISARSSGEVNVQVIMEKMGGGGHLDMAGAQLRGVELEEALTQIRSALKDYMENRI